MTLITVREEWRWRMVDTIPFSGRAVDDHPHYKMEAHGVGSLTNAELLSLIIGTGMDGKNVVALCERLLASCGDNLNALARLSAYDLMQLEGIGPRRAASIVAAIELGRRRQMEGVSTLRNMGSASAVFQLMRPVVMDLSHEEAHILLLNNRLGLIRRERIGVGGITEVAVDVRIILRSALISGATAMIFVHNHPSGSLTPSGNDDSLTERLRKACEVMRVYLADHVIVTDSGYYSYREQGRL